MIITYKKSKDWKEERSPSSIFEGEYENVFLGMSQEVSHETINAIHDFVLDRKKDFSGSQLRKLYNQVKKANFKEAPMLRVKLAYMRGRSDKNGMKELLKIVDALLKKIDRDTGENNFNGIKALLEAVVSFHALHGNVNS